MLHFLFCCPVSDANLSLIPLRAIFLFVCFSLEVLLFTRSTLYTWGLEVSPQCMWVPFHSLCWAFCGPFSLNTWSVVLGNNFCSFHFPKSFSGTPISQMLCFLNESFLSLIFPHIFYPFVFLFYLLGIPLTL